MLTQTYPSIRKPTVYQPPANTPWFTTREEAEAKKRGIPVGEFIRRDTIVKQLFRECPYGAGDTVYPAKKQDFKKYGVCKILSLCASYSAMGINETWPKSDNPMIVAFTAAGQEENVIHCTTNYLSTTMPETEETC
jgi:hypothetical protein